MASIISLDEDYFMADAVQPAREPAAPALTYFEQARQKFIQAEFGSDREKIEYGTSLVQWGPACEQARVVRRQFYRVDKVVPFNELETQALHVCKIESADGKRSINVLFYRIPVNRFEVDAAINAANETLLGGGGVDKEIHDGAGPNLVRECAANFEEGCPVGGACITKGYDLPAKYVLHTVGPLLKEDETGDERMLASCYINCLRLCDSFNLKTVVAPCVACGFYAFPLAQSAKVVKQVIQNYVDKGGSTVQTVILSVPKDTEWNAYTTEFTQKDG